MSSNEEFFDYIKELLESSLLPIDFFKRRIYIYATSNGFAITSLHGANSFPHLLQRC
jgi:hypothetical protein